MSEYSDQPPEKSSSHSASNTHFKPHEASEELQEKFRTLWYYNENLRRDRSNTNSEEVRRREKNHIFDSISSSLDLPEYQHRKAKQIISQTNFNDLLEGRYLSLETYCFAICVFVHNQNVDSFKRKYIPKNDTSKIPELFREVQDEIGISNYELEQALHEIRKEVNANV